MDYVKLKIYVHLLLPSTGTVNYMWCKFYTLSKQSASGYTGFSRHRWSTQQVEML